MFAPRGPDETCARRGCTRRVRLGGVTRSVDLARYARGFERAASTSIRSRRLSRLGRACARILPVGGYTLCAFPRDAPAPRADPRRPTTPRDRTLTPIPTIIPITSQRLESGRDTSDARPSGGATGALRAPRCRPRMTRRGVTAEGTKTVRRKWDPRARPNARRPLPPYLARRPRPVSRDGGRPRGPRPIPLLPRAHASFLFHTTSRMRLLWSRGAPPRASAPVAPPSPPPRKKPGTAPRIVAARARARARP